MKKIVFLVSITLVFLILYQCQKQNVVLSHKSDGIANNLFQEMNQEILASNWEGEVIPHYNNELCIPSDLGCDQSDSIDIEVVPVSSLIPPGIIGDCKVIASYDFCINEQSTVPYISYYNFALGIPRDGDCSNLSNYLNSLSDDDRNLVINDIAIYVKFEGINMLMSVWVENLGVYCDNMAFATAEFYEAKCSKKCRVGFTPKDYGIFKISIGWWYYFVNCGNGCCITSTDYCMNADGTLYISAPMVESNGDCVPGPPSDWELLFCGDVVEPCRQRCGN